MPPTRGSDGTLRLGGVDLVSLIDQVGTPAYVYDIDGIGADVVRGAELLVALAFGIAPQRIVYSGVAKQDGELDRAIACGIGAVQIESVEEIARVESRARMLGRKARMSVRVNPSVDLAG